MRALAVLALVILLMTPPAHAAKPTGGGNPNVITIDEQSSDCQLIGTWADARSGGFGTADSVGGNQHYTSSHPPKARTGKEKAIFTPRLAKPGMYKVEIGFHATTNRSTKVAFEVTYDGGKKRYVISQKVDGKNPVFHAFGVYPFTPGGGGNLAMVSDFGQSASVDAGRFTYMGEIGTVPMSEGGSSSTLDNLVNPGSGKDGGKAGGSTFTVEKDGPVSVIAKLSTYGAASLKVTVKGADGKERAWLNWTRKNDVDPSPLEENGQPVAESMAEVKPGDWSAVETTRTYEAKKGDVLTLTLEGDFGAGDPVLKVKK